MTVSSMFWRSAAWGLVLGTACGLAAAQTIYRIVGPDGNPPKPGQPPIPGVTAVERIPAMWSDRTKKGRHNSVTIPEAGNTSLDYKIPAK